jgi:CheY-like chemotaxis protein
MPQRGWILLGEDDPDDVVFIRRAFESADVEQELMVARNGQEVLDCLNAEERFRDRPSGEPSVIVLDHRMPILDGLTVLRRLKEHPIFKHIPVVMYSGAMTRRQIDEAYELDVSAFVQKPGDFGTFIRIFSCLGLFWTRGNVHPGTFVSG